MIWITSIEQALRNFAKTPINLSHKVEESQMQVLCKKQFGWEVTYPNQKGDHEHALVVQPKIICLNPFLLITVPQDDFYEDLIHHQKIIVCICPETIYIDTLNDTFRISNQVYGQTIHTGLRSYSLSGELFIQNRKEYRVVQIQFSEAGGNANKVIHTLVD